MLAGAAILASLGVAIVTVSSGSSPDAQTALTFLVFLIAFGSLHLAIRQWAPDAAPYLLPLVAVITAVGVAEIYRLDPRSATLQRWWLLIAAAFGVATIAVLSRTGTDLLRRYRYLSLAGAIACFLLPLLPTAWPLGGVEVNGSRLWLAFTPFERMLVRFQPAEIGKLLMVVFLASYLASRQSTLSEMTRRIGRVRMPEPRQLLPVILAWTASLLVLVYQRDLGASALLMAVFVTMLYASSGRAVYLVAGGGLFLVGAVATTRFYEHAQDRIDAWLDPFADFADTGYQVSQSLFALGTGSLSGSGLGLGRPDFIPSATTDFIFAAVAEETGLVGSIGVIAAYALLVTIGFGIALAARDPFRKLLAAGLTATIAIQTILIVGGVTRLLPVTGITLPFMSYGGSSLVANVIAIAVLARISHETATSEGMSQ